MIALTPDQLKHLLQTLHQAQIELILVGGQAINLWAMQYKQATPAWDTLLPYASVDLDFYGGRIEAVQCGQVLGGQVTLAQNFDPSPNAGVVMVNWHGIPLRIDILASVYGLADAEIASTALEFVGSGPLAALTLKVLHPLLCLESKLKCLQNLDQTTRQDEKHVRLAVLILESFLSEQLAQSLTRQVLNLVERLVDNAWTDAGLNAWYRYGIQIETAIPLAQIQTLDNPQWQSFHGIRWPQIHTHLSTRRSRYKQLMENFRSE